MALLSRACSLTALLVLVFVSTAILADEPGEFDFYVLSLSW
ncbi:MAG: hypothetical protein AAGF82_21030 [Pseudomonadota bacterium]